MPNVFRRFVARDEILRYQSFKVLELLLIGHAIDMILTVSRSFLRTK